MLNEHPNKRFAHTRMNRNLGLFQIGVENKAYHSLSHFEIGGDTRIYQHL
jgi:hypothetical protein